MKRNSLAAWVLASSMTAALSGCYVVPIDPRYPHEYGQSTVVTQPGQAPVIVPAPLAVPVTLHARLYPVNDVAGNMGVLTALVTDTLNGHATFTVNYSGDSLQGEASRVANDYPGFGNIHLQVYGDGRMPTGRRGIASAAGGRGNFVNCEYALSAAAQGTGACLFSNGAKYQLHFGS
jgi:hypothetical protein